MKKERRETREKTNVQESELFEKFVVDEGERVDLLLFGFEGFLEASFTLKGLVEESLKGGEETLLFFELSMCPVEGEEEDKRRGMYNRRHSSRSLESPWSVST